jgi:hypothetical protein
VLALVLLGAVAYEIARQSPALPDFPELPTLWETRARRPSDAVPPEIHGVRDLEAALYGTLAYKEGVSVTDDSGWAALEVDSSEVDTGVPGVYAIVYTARDAAGNETRVTAKVAVLSVSEEELALLAEPVLEEIVLPGMSDEEMALAIHAWVKANITYTNTGDKDSVLEGAFNGLTLYQGDCYTFYALAKYLLGRVGIESIDMRRVPEAETRHYWLALNFGAGWHHYDASPATLEYGQYRARGGFMMTEGEAQAFADACGRPDYYSYPAECLPEGVEIVP